MSNYADTESLTTFASERPEADFGDFDPTGFEAMTDEDWADYEARNAHADEVWGAYDPDLMPFGTDFDATPPF